MTLVSEWALLPRTRGKSDCPSPSGSLGQRKLARLAPQVHFARAEPFFFYGNFGFHGELGGETRRLVWGYMPFSVRAGTLPNSHV